GEPSAVHDDRAYDGGSAAAVGVHDGCAGLRVRRGFVRSDAGVGRRWGRAVSGVPLSGLVSHPGTTRGFGAADRLDPFWDGLWANGSTASWLSAELAERQ